MRRIIHNTTAIAACLSLMAPHLALAQTSLPGGNVLAQAEPEGEPLPVPEGGEPAPAEAPADEPPADEPPAEAPPAEAPEPEAPPAEEPPAEDVPAEAPPAEAPEPVTEPPEAPEAQAAPEPAPEPAPAEVPAQSEPAPEPRPEAQAETPPDARPEAVETEAPEVRPQTQDAPSPEPRPEGQPDAAPAPRPERAEESTPGGEGRPNARPARDANAPSEATPAQVPADAPADVPTETGADGGDESSLEEALRAAEESQPADIPAEAEAEPATAASEPAEGTLEEALRAADEAATPAEPGAQDEAETVPGAPGAAEGLALATGPVQGERASALPGLANVLEREVSGGLDASQLTCLDGGTFPCADGGRAMTPSGVVVETNDAGALRLAPTEVQMYRVQDGQMVRRAAEESAPETEASREAAEASEPSTAVALAAEEGTGDVTEQQVTEENSRSSSEDFATSLRDALAGATGGQQSAEAREDDGDDNRLRNALLLGLGAVAVGSYLNNNRQVALSAPDRVVVTRADGSQEVIKDEVALLRQPGSTVTTENFDDGSSRTIVTRTDGSRVVTIRDANLQVLRRTLVSADGQSTRLIDETAEVQPVDIGQLPAPAPVQTGTAPLNEEELRAALQREANVDRRFTLSQIRNIPEVRALVAPINIDAITFDTGSAAIRADQAQQLQGLGRAIQDQIAQNPREIFMIEGHTDTVGSNAANLALSDRRAESVALALSEYFEVPPENLVTQGYGEQFLRVRAEGDIRDNRRASVRRITDLLAQ